MKIKLPEICQRVGSGIVLLDDSFKVLDINKEMEVKGSISRTMALGKTFLDFIPEERRRKIKSMLETARDVERRET